MAINKQLVNAAALLVLALGATAARESEIGRALLQSEHVSVSGSTPAVSASLSESLSGLSGFIRDLINDITSDVSNIVSDVTSGVGSITSAVSRDPAIATIETDTSDGFEAARHNLQSALNALTDALPPMPAGLPLPAAGLPVAGLPVLDLPVQSSTPTTTVRPSG